MARQRRANVRGAVAACPQGLYESTGKGEKKVFAKPQVWQGTEEKFTSLSQCVARVRSLTKPFLNWTPLFFQPLVAFWAHSTCLSPRSVTGRLWTIRIIRNLFPPI